MMNCQCSLRVAVDILPRQTVIQKLDVGGNQLNVLKPFVQRRERRDLVLLVQLMADLDAGLRVKISSLVDSDATKCICFRIQVSGVRFLLDR